MPYAQQAITKIFPALGPDFTLDVARDRALAQDVASIVANAVIQGKIVAADYAMLLFHLLFLP
jgi:hypothetical protein